MPASSPDTAPHAHVDGLIPPQLKDATAADLHGRAALLLVESLIHALVDKNVISCGEAIDIIDIATEVEIELASAHNGDGQTATMLPPLAKTFRLELRMN